MSELFNVECSACGLSRPKSGWRCPHCQTAHGWHALVDFTIPVLSLIVAIVALLPTAIPPIRNILMPPKANVYVNAEYVNGRGELLFTFVNTGEADAIISSLFDCEYRNDESRADFFSRAPVVVPAKSSVSRNYEVDIFEWGDRLIDATISSHAVKHEFFRTSNITTQCIFASDPSDEIEYYDFGDIEFFVGFNIIIGAPFGDSVDFRFETQ